MKPLFSNINAMSERITLIEDDKILSKAAEYFDAHFTNIKHSLDTECINCAIRESAFNDKLIEADLSSILKRMRQLLKKIIGN